VTKKLDGGIVWTVVSSGRWYRLDGGIVWTMVSSGRWYRLGV